MEPPSQTGAGQVAAPLIAPGPQMPGSSQAPALGHLDQVDPRTIWPHEALHFTPWLLDNAERLAEALGIELELTEAEHPIGGFSLDLVGRDMTNGTVVIVENQLEASDHTHLGQVLTYAAGTSADTIVWLTTNFRDEHRQALTWLNEHTDENTHFFGVELQVVRIGQSVPAPVFRVVVQPNDWQKAVKAASSPRTAGGRGALYAGFWEKYLNRVRAEHPGWTRARASTQSWLWMTAPIRSCGLSSSFAAGGKIRHELYIDAPTNANEALLIDRIIHDAVQLPTMVRFCERDQVTPEAVEDLATDWIRGFEIDTLRQSHPAVALGDPMRFLTVIDSLVCRDLPWAVSSLLIMLDFRAPDFAVSRPTLLTLTSMLKFGVPTPGACFASSMGVTARTDAIGVGALFATSGGLTYQLFRAWLDTVPRQELIDASSIPAADRLLDRAVRRRSAANLLDTIGRGDSEAVLRVVVPAADEAAALRTEPGAPVALRRTPSTDHPDRIVIDDARSRTIGQLASEDAHTIAPLLDSGILDGAATVHELRMLQSGRVLLRISVELTPLTASARR